MYIIHTVNENVGNIILGAVNIMGDVINNALATFHSAI